MRVYTVVRVIQHRDGGVLNLQFEKAYLDVNKANAVIVEQEKRPGLRDAEKILDVHITHKVMPLDVE